MHTVPCLEHLRHTTYPNLSVLVVDNGSTDDSVARLLSAFPAQKLLETGMNLGFGAGNNRGITQALADGAEYIWLLNNDTFVQPDTLSALVQTAQKDPQLGQIGSVLLYADDPRKIQAWGGGNINLWTGSTRHYERPVAQSEIAYLTAASVLIPAKTLQQVGIFDESYFMYFEDTDLSLRIKAKGWKLGVCPDAKLLHREGASSGAMSPLFDGLLTASGIIFLRKYAPMPAISLLLFVGGRALKRSLSRRRENAKAILYAWKQRNLPSHQHGTTRRSADSQIIQDKG